MASGWGVRQFRFLSMPHPVANLAEAELEQRADDIVIEVVGLLQQGQAS